MTLGQKLFALRTKRGLTQSGLAEELNVSRQSVSKWETDASVPEVELLLALSDFYGVTVDDLLRPDRIPGVITPAEAVPVDEEAPAAAESPAAGPAPAQSGGLRPGQIVGLILLGVGLALFLLFLFLSGTGAGLLPALPFLVCGGLCLGLRRPLLPCLWALALFYAVYLRYCTGVRPWWVFFPWLYRPEMTVHAVLAWTLALAGLCLATGRKLVRFRRRKKAD